jgi:ubiquinone/menaquinone biosynthesis C-methylase UbiE
MEGFVQPRLLVNDFGIEPGMLVADFGAGSGVFTHAIADLLERKGRVYAIDVQRDLLRRIKNEANRRNQPHVDVVWSDLEHEGGSKLADETTDFVLMSNILFQLQNRQTALQEAARILKPTGRLVIIDWSDPSVRVGPHRSQMITQEQAIELLRSIGFIKYHAFEAGNHHYGLMLPRPAYT